MRTSSKLGIGGVAAAAVAVFSLLQLTGLVGGIIYFCAFAIAVCLFALALDSLNY